MNGVDSNLWTIVSIVSFIITLFFLFMTLFGGYLNKKKLKIKQSQINEKDNEYNKVKNITHIIKIEKEQKGERNYQDERTYLNRANLIRKKSSFFSWINK